MNIIYTSILYLCMATGSAVAGDDASGPIPYSIDLSQPFMVYEMSSHDNGRSASLVKKLNYKGAVAHSVRTTLSLKIDKKTVRGAVYQAIEKPDYFYVINGDAMLKLDTRWAYNPGVGGFSMHAPAIAKLYRVSQLRWWSAIPFELSGKGGKSHLERTRLGQIERMKREEDVLQERGSVR